MNYQIFRGKESRLRASPKQCVGKKKYRLKEAQQTVNTLHKMGRFKKARIYECPDCNLWHISREREPA